MGSISNKKREGVKIKERHRILLKKMSENVGSPKSMGEAMRELNYSKSYSESPSRIRQTASWQSLVEQELPDELLASVHRDLLTNENWRARDAGLEKAYKIKSKYKEQKIEHPFSQLSDKELEEEMARVISDIVAGLVKNGGIKNFIH